MSAAISPVPPSAPDLPAAIVALDRCLREEIAVLEVARQQAEHCDRLWAGTSVTSKVEAPDRKAVSILVKEVIREVLKIANEELSQPGARLQCNADAWVENNLVEPAEKILRRRSTCADQRYAQVEKTFESFRAADLWKHLVSSYPPERVIELARQRAAITVANVFSLHRRKEIRRVAGRIEMIITRYSEAPSRYAKRRYTCYRDQDLMRIPEAFAVFKTASGLDSNPVDLLGIAEAIARTCNNDFQFVSRDRIDFAGGLSVVFFNTEIKIYLPDDIGTALNVFVSTYGAEALRDR